MGVFEWPRLRRGHKAVAEAVAKADAHSVVGGADSVRALTEMGLVDEVDWASTGGGAASSSWKGKNCPEWPRSRRLAVLIAGNWKMYKGQAETAEFCIELKRSLADLEAVEVAVCPPFPSLAVAVQILAGTDIAVAAQNVPLGGRRRVHRRGLGADAARAGRLRRHRRPL